MTIFINKNSPPALYLIQRIYTRFSTGFQNNTRFSFMLGPRFLTVSDMDSHVYTFTVVAGGIAIYNSLELFFMLYTSFRRYNSLYFASLLTASFGVLLFAVGFLDLFFEIFIDNSTIVRPLVVLTIGWYGMITGFASVMYSRLHIVRCDPQIITWVWRFMMFNVCFSHFPTTVFTFGANISGTDFWVDGYAIIEKIQMTLFCIQEVTLGLLYLYYIRDTSGCNKKKTLLLQHTVSILLKTWPKVNSPHIVSRKHFCFISRFSDALS